jgi:hypothetical protein
MTKKKRMSSDRRAREREKVKMTNDKKLQDQKQN